MNQTNRMFLHALCYAVSTLLSVFFLSIAVYFTVMWILICKGKPLDCEIRGQQRDERAKERERF